MSTPPSGDAALVEPFTGGERAAQFRGRAALEAHDLAVDQRVEVHCPSAGTAGCGATLVGRVSARSTDRVLVLQRGSEREPYLDRIPWAALWLIRTRGEDD